MLVVIAQDRNGEDPYNEARANVSVRGGNMQPTTPPMHCLSPQDPILVQHTPRSSYELFSSYTRMLLICDIVSSRQ